jgi:hypothetical protein
VSGQPTEVTTTSTDRSRVLAVAPSSQSPANGPPPPAGSDLGDAEAAALAGNEQPAGERSAEWIIAPLAMVIVGVMLWVADRLIKGDRRRYMLGLSRHR